MRKLLPIIAFFLFSCNSARKVSTNSDTRNTAIKSKIVLKDKIPARTIDTKDVSADEFVTYAETLVGFPYQFGGADKEKGFDCSGLLYFIFNRYNIIVPRTSIEYTNVGNEVNINEARRGDLILFTGSDASSGRVGHIGIVTENKNNRVRFIHSSSGKGNGVMVSEMNSYFIQRFVKVNRVFKAA